jgi:hypothetical protein
MGFVLLEIHGHHFPGRSWHVDGEPCHHLHVGLQVRHDPAGLVPGDSDAAVWSAEIEVVDRGEGADFRGPPCKAKLMLDDLTSVAGLGDPGRRVVARVDLTDECGGPRCARLRAPALQLGGADPL